MLYQSIDALHVAGDAVDVAVLGGEVRDAGGADSVLGFLRQQVVDRAQHAGLGLFLEHAAAPRVEHVRRVG